MAGSVSVSDPKRQLAAADLQPGSVVAERTVVFDRKVFAAFAAMTGDSHPIHYDDAYAGAQGLRAPIAHGLLVVAMTALGATKLSTQLHDSMLAMVGVDAQFFAPVFDGDNVTIRLSVDSIAPKSGNRSLAVFAVEVVSPDGTLHARVHQRFLLKTHLQE